LEGYDVANFVIASWILWVDTDFVHRQG